MIYTFSNKQPFYCVFNDFVGIYYFEIANFLNSSSFSPWYNLTQFYHFAETSMP